MVGQYVGISVHDRLSRPFLIGRRARAESACGVWSASTAISFARNPHNADIRIYWFSREHGRPPDIPFDGRGGELGHAWRPDHPWRGELHLDADETWAIDTPASENADLITQLIHELGHVLGLDHNSNRTSIMYPAFEPHEVKRVLSDGDITAIQGLYGAP